VISKKLYNNLPYYLRMLDEQGSGLLKHLTNPIQTQFDKWEDSKGLLELINNPDTIPKDWAYWAQQKVGGSGTREYWLGVGVHPDWSADRMRRFLKEAWNYWNTKGTQPAIRWAIDFWLDWEKAQSPIYLEFRRPFGDRPTSSPPQWWSYETPYNTHFLQHYTERQFLGGGDYPQQYQPDYLTLKQDVWRWEYDTVWDDRQLIPGKPDVINNSRSGLGPRNVWMHFHLEETEWNNVVPDIHKLNPETWHSLARPQVFLWQDISTILNLVEDPEFPVSQTTIFYDIDGFKYNDVFPWLTSQASRTEIQIISHAWQPEPYAEYNDFWGSTGRKLVAHEDRYQKVEVQRFVTDWTAYDFLATVSETIYLHSEPDDRIFFTGSDYQTQYTESEVWSFSLLQSPDGEESVVTQTVQAIGFKGAQYSDVYAWQIPTTKIQTETTVLRYLPGADYQSCYDETWTCVITETVVTEIEQLATFGTGIPWTIRLAAWTEIVEKLIPGVPEFTEPSTTHLWYVPYREWDEEIEVEIPSIQSCWPGLLANVEESTHEVIAPAELGFLPNIWGDVIPNTQIKTIIPGDRGSVGFDYFSPFLSSQLPQTITHNLLPISLAGIAPITNTIGTADPMKFNPYFVFDLFGEPDDAIDSEDWWQYPATPASETITTTIGGFRLNEPQLCFQYLDAYGENFEWYVKGEVNEPITKIETTMGQYHLCNVVDNFTLRKIENYREVVEIIPVADRAIEKIYPLLQIVAKQQEWTLSVETDEELILVQPLVLFAEKNGARSLAIDLDSKLNIEFVFVVGRSTHIHSISLFVGQVIVESKTYTIPLNVHPKDKIGFKFLLNLLPAPLTV
jgi:hypothetical protein